MLAVHLTGSFLVCKAALPSLRAAGGGAIVNVASTAGLRARANLAAYAAAKGGIVASRANSHLMSRPTACASTS